MQPITFTGLQITGLVLVVVGALFTFVFPHSSQDSVPAKRNVMKAAGLAFVAAGALLILI